MKKTLLLATLMLGALTGINAQESISFETTEGFTLGQLSGQNGWIVTGGEGDGSEITQVTVANDLEGYATNALKFIGMDSEADPIEATKQIIPGSNNFSIINHVYADGRDVDNGSDITFTTRDLGGDEVLLLSGIKFEYDGNIQILYSYSDLYDEYFYTDVENTTFEANTWYEVKTTFDISAGTVAYYLNDQLLRTVPFIRGIAVDAMTCEFDDYTSSFYVDDISVVTETAGLSKATAPKFSVYPNPATTIVNITNSSNALVNSISVTDLNGRTVKSSLFAGIANVQVNIADLSAGMYMLNITSDQGTVTKKIVKN